MWYGSLKEGSGYLNTCQSSSLCKVRLLTECQWPYVLASLACQWSGCWLVAGWSLGCDAAKWSLLSPMLCDHWCCLVSDIASWSLATQSPQNLGLAKYFGCFMVNYEFTSEVIMSDAHVSWIPYWQSLLSADLTLCGKILHAVLQSQGRKLKVSNKLFNPYKYNYFNVSNI